MVSYLFGMENDIRKVKIKKKEEWKMKGLTKKLERIFLAITFAEEGEFDTARQMLMEEVETENSDVKSQKCIQVPVTATES